MKPEKEYLLQRLNNIPYLLPYGQNIADFMRGIRLNETGAFLWEDLQHAADRHELLQIMCQEYNAPVDVLAQDLDQFLNTLRICGILDRDFKETNRPTHQSKRLLIGGLRVDLCGEDSFFSTLFDPFLSDSEEKACLTVEVYTRHPLYKKNGAILLRSRDLILCECEDAYLLFYPSIPQIQEALLAKDGSRIRFYCPAVTGADTAPMLFYAIRTAFLYLAQMHQMYALHSVSILYKGKAWLFSGHAGMGKSTHTALWNKYYDTPILNGDLNLLSLTDEGPVIHGMPWCGTSGIADTHTWPLGGILLLGRSPQDQCVPLAPDEKQLLVMQRLISPTWTKEMVSHSLDFTGELTSQIPVCRLLCTKEPSAAETAKAWIDSL